MGGFDAKNKTTLNVIYICSQCSLILQDPVQLSECGHRRCKSCIDIQQQTMITCPVCHTQTPTHLIRLDRGFKREMESLSIECFLCPWTGILKDYQPHLDELHSHPTCQYCNLSFNSVNKLSEHQLLQCQQVTTNCLLKDFGCDQQIIRGKKQEHFQSHQHQHILMKVVQQMISQHQTNHSYPTTTMTTDNTAPSHFQEVEDVLGILMSGVETLIDDGQRLTRESVQLQLQLHTLAEEASQVKLSTEESRSYVEGVKQNLDILRQDLSSLKEKINDLEHVSYDGTFVWKITNVTEKMNDARSERQISIFSPPFYSSSNGYKMRLRLYLYGDGNARRSHLSLFFVLMRGVNDAILKFPFDYKVTFCLYDQSGQGKHVIDSFRPDIRSNSFQRPRSDFNIASGIPKFMALSTIDEDGGRSSGYVVDDTMFIKVLIDFDGMAKALLPYAMSLNPGLPANVQQMLIKQETERRSHHQTAAAI
ncbi:hypothetical protein I4U23_025290 [Adineta vaga]|nr:hypothetical protein I4U23_025290 [Adineta vaga]